MMNDVFLLTGGNLGDRALTLSSALDAIGEQLGTLKAVSAVYETAPWGFTHEQPFLNQAVHITTPLSPIHLLEGILDIERKLGRVRGLDQWRERIIDIDILFFGSEVIMNERLNIPHPYLHERRFALVPLGEIAGEFIHPIFRKPVRQLLDECPDPLPVMPYIL